MSLDPRVDDTDGDVVLSTRDLPIGVALRHRGELTGENVCVNVPPEIPNVKAHRVEFAAGLIRHAKAGGADLSLAIYKNPEDGEWHVVVVDLEFEGDIPRWFTPWAGDRMKEFGDLLERLEGWRRGH